MRGKVNAQREAILALRTFGPRQRSQKISAIIDTGYTGSLTLPRRIIQTLRLRRIGSRDAETGDGRIISFNVYAGWVLWNRRRRAIDIDEAETDPLIGMEFLDNCDLNICVRPGGAVNVRLLR